MPCTNETHHNNEQGVCHLGFKLAMPVLCHCGVVEHVGDGLTVARAEVAASADPPLTVING